MTTPLVTAVMVTGKPGRSELFPKAAIASFLAQDWPRKELVIVNDGSKRWVTHGDDMSVPGTVHTYRCESHKDAAGNWCPIVEVEPDGMTAMTLGELRNLGLKMAQGSWVAQWDDDDFFHPTRLSVQMEHARKHPDSAILFLHQVRYSMTGDSAWDCLYDRPYEGIPGSVLHPRRTGDCYQSISKHEDSRFLNAAFGDRRVIIDNPAELHLRFYHGANTWGERHIMWQFAETAYRGVWQLPPPADTFLRQVLLDHFPTLLSEDTLGRLSTQVTAVQDP